MMKSTVLSVIEDRESVQVACFARLQSLGGQTMGTKYIRGLVSLSSKTNGMIQVLLNMAGAAAVMIKHRACSIFNGTQSNDTEVTSEVAQAKCDELEPITEEPPEEYDNDQYCDQLTIVPVPSLPEGWEWRMYDDGSGGLYSPEGKEIIDYDFATSEYRDLRYSHDDWRGKWRFLSGYPYETQSQGEFMRSIEESISVSLKSS